MFQGVILTCVAAQETHDEDLEDRHTDSGELTHGRLT